ncbi:chorion class CB protein M5H4-like [Bombyx mandarina]|uniref:Chorion class CB protein M5H4-like n=1 Tax=Bombyx mandarina TaxID=7092 RepID=A0A6J2JIL0_BOMMA|nr:chorion class CB protein M5H4-like [Bombyx mandarina]
MALRTALFCFSALLVQKVHSQCLGRGAAGPYPPYGPGWGAYDAVGYDGYAPGGFIGLAPGNLAASCGGGLAVTSTSPITPTGLTVNSENSIEGTVTIVGQLPFLGAVATDGVFSSAGGGTVVYGCGDGAIGITNEMPISAPIVGPGYGPVGRPYPGFKGIGPC